MSKVTPAMLAEVRGYEEPQLPANIFPGLYPVYYHVVVDDSVRKYEQVACAECATAALYNSETHELYVYTYYEGPALECERCGVEIESAYGDPYAPAAPECIRCGEEAVADTDPPHCRECMEKYPNPPKEGC